MSGLTFGNLKVLKVDEASFGKGLKWLCLCVCGKEKCILGESLRSGATSSCGCVRAKKLSKLFRADLTGRRFDRLVAIDAVDKDTPGVYWNCICDCGNRVVSKGTGLLGGNHTSCGCKKSERFRRIAEGRRIKSVGNRYGRLLVISEQEYGENNGRRRDFRATCICDCGTEKIIKTSMLTSGKVISCGCAVRDQLGLLPKATRARASVQESVRRARKRGVSGRYTADQIENLYLMQQKKCACCRKQLNGKFHRDHKTPLALGGSNDITNIELLCAKCNMAKSDKDPIEWAKENGRLI